MASSGHPFCSLEGHSLQDQKIIVYTSSGCPKCIALKRWLRSRHADFEERNLEDVEVMATLIMDNIFVLSAPVLEVKGVVYTEDQIFDGDGVVRIDLLEIAEGK
jgi:glutaredoxin